VDIGVGLVLPDNRNPLVYRKYKQHLDSLRRKDSLRGAEITEISVRLGNYSASHFEGSAYKALGLPLGSGMVESACKWLIQQRFKGVGMRWSEEGFNHLLHLRLAWVNGSFEALWQIQTHASPNK
jgi:hypothetical protein